MTEFNLHNSQLGKQASTPEKYDASLLFRIPRAENRVHYGIDNDSLPFVGYDVWNCYEVSFLTDNGLPVSRVLKLVYSSNSEFLVESKSLKLYLNAFNMDRFGKSVAEAETKVAQMIASDLKQLLETEVQVTFFTADSLAEKPFAEIQKTDLCDFIPGDIQESIKFSRFVESPELLRSTKSGVIHEYSFHTDLLRSNCRVTNQPDWGDLFVQMSSKCDIEMSSILEYLVSFRKENHFHEEVVEMIYKRFHDFFEPSNLVVAAMYTRRGGIDINPIRASHPDLIDKVLVSKTSRAEKTLRQ